MFFSAVVLTFLTASPAFAAPLANSSASPSSSSRIFGKPLLLKKESYPFAHEAPMYIPALGGLYFASNRLGGVLTQTELSSSSASGSLRPAKDEDGASQTILSNMFYLSPTSSSSSSSNESAAPIIDFDSFTKTVSTNESLGKLQIGLPIDIPMPNGAVLLDDTHLLICGQGNLTAPAGLYQVNVKTWETLPVLTELHISASSSILGQVVVNTSAISDQTESKNKDFVSLPFNSPNDLVLSKSKNEVFFTDPVYGSKQGFRPSTPTLKNAVYRGIIHRDEQNKSNISISHVEPVVLDLSRPNGVALSVNESVLYVSESGYYPGQGINSEIRPSIYAYDIIRHGTKKNVTLSNKRLFAITPKPAPDGIKIDPFTNRLYVGDGSGVLVYDGDSGQLIDSISPALELSHGDGGITNLAFVENTDSVSYLFGLGETALYLIPITQ